MAGPELVGKTGSVTTAVRGGAKPGEVRIVVEGIPHYYLAFCARPLPVASTILVINNRGHRQLDVEPWDPVAPGAAQSTSQNSER